MAVLTYVRRTQSSLESYGYNIDVFLHVGENQRADAIIQTRRDFLILYSITIADDQLDTRYKFDTTRSAIVHRRRSFAGAGESESIIPYSIKYKRTIKVENRVSW